MARGQSGRPKVIPECQAVIDQWKYEIAEELGLPVGNHATTLQADAEFATELGTIQGNSLGENYWGHIATRETGAVGGRITQRLIQQAEQALFGSL